jgi:hypothetical protein
MNAYNRLIDLLAQLTADGEITEEQAAGILLNWQTLTGLETILPLPMAEGIREEEIDDDMILAILIAVLGARARGARRPADIYARLAPQYRRPVIDMIQDYHATQAGDLAEDLAAGRLSIEDWQRRVRTLNQSVTRAMAELGAGRDLRGMRDRLTAIQRTQAAYLQRFAEQIAARRLIAANPQLFPTGAAGLTVNQIAARVRLYTGAGRALFFEGAEQDRQGDAGWVIRYEARDDPDTCSPCSAAEGYYLPGEGPYPGDVCLGAGNCRCVRFAVFAPDVYARLIAP